MCTSSGREDRWRGSVLWAQMIELGAAWPRTVLALGLGSRQHTRCTRPPVRCRYGTAMPGHAYLHSATCRLPMLARFASPAPRYRRQINEYQPSFIDAIMLQQRRER